MDFNLVLFTKIHFFSFLIVNVKYASATMGSIRKQFRYLVYILTAIGVLSLSCEKDPILEDPAAKLVFSTDTLLFDTIFTTIGSSTRHFKVYNPYDRSLEISSIRLSGDTSSPFRINVDGIPGREFSDILMRGGDSIFIFIEATIDPVNGNHPVIVSDSVVFTTNGNVQDVKLAAWGQDVEIIRDEVYGNETLSAERPYLVYGYMMVDTNRVLTLDPGVRIHFYRNSGLYVAGTIIAEGTGDNPVIIEGARTEASYRNIPGQWDGIRLMPGSTGNRFVNVRVRNAVNGILADTVYSEGSTTLYLADSRIENMTHAGLIGRGATIYAYNTVISNCGYYLVALTAGGDYTFYHCTLANYWNMSSRRTPSIVIENYYTDTGGGINVAPVRAVFGNTIIHGNNSREVGFSVHSEGTFDVLFDHCLAAVPPALIEDFEGLFVNCLTGVDPLFLDPAKYNFRPDEDSPAIDAGNPDTGNLHPLDFDGKSRISDNAPDIGAFEWYPEN